MKLFLLAAAAVLALPAADLGEFKTVYLLPMSNGLDQFLAIKLTSGSVMQVVTDPNKADAILTDHIGNSFEQKLDEMYGKKQKEDEDKGRTGMQNASRGRGAIFLVDRKTRDVIWSVYERPKSTAPDDMNHTAEKIAQKLEKDRKGK
jgi:hypothetical protein